MTEEHCFDVLSCAVCNPAQYAICTLKRVREAARVISMLPLPFLLAQAFFNSPRARWIMRCLSSITFIILYLQASAAGQDSLSLVIFQQRY